MGKEWIRDRLERLGRTQLALARHLGLDPSAVSRLLRSERQLKGAEAAAIAAFFDCPVEEVLRAFGADPPPAPPVEDGFQARPLPLPAAAELARDLPVYGSAIGGEDGGFEFNGQVAELIERPPQLRSARNAYAVYVSGDSMHPVFRAGWLLHVNPNRPVTADCGVVVQIRPEDEHGLPLCYVKEFVRRTPSRLVLRQFNPARDIEWPLPRVLAIHRVVGIAEM